MSVAARLARLETRLGLSVDPIRRITREKLQERLLALNQALVADPRLPLALRREVAIRAADVDPDPQRSQRILTGMREFLIGRPKDV